MRKTDRSILDSEPMAKPTRSCVDHTADVIAAFISLFGKVDQPTELTRRWLAFFKLRESDLRSFLRNGLLSCYIHDWGKANTSFAGMLLKAGSQTIRHEVVSALIATQPAIWKWLQRAPEIDLPVVLAAVAGHHLKAALPQGGRNSREFGATQDPLHTEMTLTWQHPRIQAQIREMAAEFGLDAAIPGGVPTNWSLKNSSRPNTALLCDGIKQAREHLDDLGEELDEKTASPRARMLRAVRSALIAADSAGSALFRTHEETERTDDVREHIRRWIAEAFDPASKLDETRIYNAVINPRLQQLRESGRSFDWNEFQQACADPLKVPERALLLAPCGSGKTLAAWRWIAARCRERPIARAIFLYPTRGTATEGYRDYAGHAGPELAALVHGTARLDLERLLDDDPRAAIDSRDREERRNREERLFALQQWPKQVFSATVDQFFAFLQHGYASTCLLPLLADSAVVLDEVHSYDRGMFTALTEFLEHFDLPVLAMTATMIERRKETLARRLVVVDGLKFGTTGSPLLQIAEHPRYQVTKVADRDEAKDEAKRALADGLRVLWVVNTVDRAQELAREFARQPIGLRMETGGDVPLLCYHSRFKLRDRRERHEEVVTAFRPKTKGRHPLLAITTQVCELSLDLDCDVLITEFAPASSLIQRFGRCCRDQEAHKNDREAGRVILYKPETAHPYSEEEMKNVPGFVSKIVGRTISQSGLESILADLDNAGFLPKQARFLHDGPWAASGQDNFRDTEDFTRQAILPGDALEYERLTAARDRRWRAQELILPVPKRDTDDTNRPRWMPSWLSFAEAKRHEYLPALGYVAKAGGGYQTA